MQFVIRTTPIPVTRKPTQLNVRGWQWRLILVDPVQRELGTELNAWNVTLNIMIGFLAAAVLFGAIGCLMLPS